MSASDPPIVPTPGPWKYHAGGCMVMDSGGQMTIADMRGWGTLSARFTESWAINTMDANGRLIAAAPELQIDRDTQAQVIGLLKRFE